MNWLSLTLLSLGLGVVVLASPSHLHGPKSQEIDAELLRELESLVQSELDEIEEEKRAKSEEKKNYGTPPNWWKSGQSASRTLRTLARVDKRTRADMIARLIREEDFLKTMSDVSNSEEIMRRVVELNLDSRADPHPTCSKATECNDRIFIDGKEYRKPNGTCNNLNFTDWGSVSVQHRRLEEPVYPNGAWRMVFQGVNGGGLPNPRTVSNAIHKAPSTSSDNNQGVSMALFQFLQFLDHDLISTPEGMAKDDRDCCTKDGGFCMPIVVPETDDGFAKGYCMDARRSFTYLRFCNGSLQQNQINLITAYIDASNVYGSSQEEQNSLRSFCGGQLKVSNMNFLPEYDGSEDIPCNDNGSPGIDCYHAGDSRNNVIPTLTAAHTLFVREHNRIAQFFGETYSDWNDEKIFQITRKIVGAQVQSIVYNEVLPILIGTSSMDTYGVNDDYAYDETIDASIFSAFALAFRIGHTMSPNVIEVDGTTYNVTFLLKSPTFLCKDNYAMLGKLQDHVDTTPLRDADGVSNRLDPDEAPSYSAPHMDPNCLQRTLPDSLRNTLFFDGLDKFDLASLNIARSREWATPTFTVYKSFCNLNDTTQWSDLLVTHTQAMIDKLSEVYKDVDLFVGIATEIKLIEALVGKVGACLIARQFRDLKFGDRFFVETTDETVGFTATQRIEIKKASYAAITCLNTGLETIPGESFNQSSESVDCSTFKTAGIKKIDLTAWSVE